MNPYPDPIKLEDVGMSGDVRIFRTIERFRFRSKKYGEIEVPAGTYTDGASIPRVFWSILSPFGEYFKAALPHDHLYTPANKTLTRAQADDILREGMIVLGVHPVKRFAIYRAVRMFGWRNYRGHLK